MVVVALDGLRCGARVALAGAACVVDGWTAPPLVRRAAPNDAGPVSPACALPRFPVRLAMAAGGTILRIDLALRTILLCKNVNIAQFRRMVP